VKLLQAERERVDALGRDNALLHRGLEDPPARLKDRAFSFGPV
jgi:hypothetical protein